MKLYAPVSSIFLLQPSRAYRQNPDETGLLILGRWFEPTPAMDQRVPDNLSNPARNPLPEESGRPSQKKEGADLKPLHITGQATVLLTEDNQKRKRSRAPLLCWFEPTCSWGLRQVTTSVTAGTTKQSRSRETRAEGERRASAGRRQRILAAKGKRKESQQSPAC